jgi:16S rRNA (guanine527-N7)-methyltransferase
VFHVKPEPGGRAGVSRETEARLDAFCELLLAWNRRINLISRHDEPLLRTRHIDDALALIPVLPAAPSHAIDLGSGAGFPGLILAIATGIPFHLVEVDQRKAAFLREATRLTAAPATVHATRIEQASLPPAPLITARALAPLPRLLELATPHLLPAGVCIFPKGRNVAEELTAASRQWHMRVERMPSPLDPESIILRLSEIVRVGS